MFKPENTLVVPVEINALVINETVSKEQFRRWRMNFFQMNRFQNPKPSAFEGETQKPFKRENQEEQGIYLHWRIPTGLQKGKVNDELKEIEFKHLPNRWLIIRQQDTVSKSWLIRSDEFHREIGKGSTYYKKENGQAILGKLGNHEANPTDIFANPPDKEYISKLDALGFGDPAFLAYQPLVNDVFSFHDTMVEYHDQESISYFVVGWYADGEKDALNGEIEDLLKYYDWKIKEGTLTQSARSVYFSRIYNVKWNDATSPISDIKSAQVAFGNHSVDALTALLKDILSREKRELLLAFLHGKLPLLNNPGGQILLEQEIRKKWFAQKYSSSFWVIEAIDKNKPIAPLTNEQKNKLEVLNKQQLSLEKTTQKLEAMQRVLYEASWRLAQKKVGNPAKFNTNEHLKKLEEKVEQQLSKEQDEKKKLKDAQSAILLNENQRLVSQGHLPFYQTYDPTILITGIKSPKFEEEKTLECQIAANIGTLHELPPPYINDPVFKILFKKFIAEKDAPELQWKQPWEPLFIEWEAEWYPIPFQRGGQPLWDFNGSEYELNAPVTDYGKGQTIRGRNFLAAQNNEMLLDQLKNFERIFGQENDPNLDEFRKFVKMLAERQFLTQHLENFNNHLLMRTTQLSLRPPNVAVNLVDQYFEQVFTPNVLPDHFQALRQGQFKFNRIIVYDGFGQCKELVGRFGLTREMLFNPKKAENLQPEKFVLEKHPQRLMELKPRILEFARLRAEFADERDNRKIFNIHKEVNPIAGWLIYNHLNKGLSFFDNIGNYLGEIRVVQGRLHKDDFKLPDGTLKSFIENIPEVVTDFEHFLLVIDETLWTIDASAGLNDKHLSVLMGRPLAIVRTRLMLEVDEFIKDLNPDLLPGKTFKEYENPIYLNKKLHHFIEESSFEIRLGSQGIRQDGLIGYFSHEGKQFNAVEKPNIIPSDSFIKVIEKGNFITTKFHARAPIDLTLLADPRASIYAQTGILPLTSISLPPHFVSQAKSNMEIPFQLHSLLTTMQKPKPELGEKYQSITIPHPALPYGKWIWEEKGENNTVSKREVKSPLEKNSVPKSPALIREGFLMLTKAFDPDKEEEPS